MVMKQYDLQAKAGQFQASLGVVRGKILFLCLSIELAFTDSISASGDCSACHKFLKLSMSFRAAYI